MKSSINPTVVPIFDNARGSYMDSIDIIKAVLLCFLAKQPSNITRNYFDPFITKKKKTDPQIKPLILFER